MTMLADITIIPAEPRHLDSLMAVMHAAFDADYGEAWSAGQLGSSLVEPHCFARMAVAGSGAQAGQAQGFSLCRSVGPDVELLLVAVAPGWQGQGIGRQLLERAARDAHYRGAAMLFLEVRENNAAAQLLYVNSGFVEIGRRPNYYKGAMGQQYAAISMQMDLSSLAG